MTRRGINRRKLGLFGLGALALAAPLALGALLGLERSVPCPEVDQRLGSTAIGPSGRSAILSYRSRPLSGRCVAALDLVVYAPGGTWEQDGLSEASTFELSTQRLGPTELQNGFVAWESATEMRIGFGQQDVWRAFVEPDGALSVCDAQSTADCAR